MKHIDVRTINYNGLEIKVTADETGTVWVGDRMASRPVTAQGMTFVWGSEKDGLPKHIKIALDKEQVQKIDAHAQAFKDAAKAQAKKARAHDNLFNEGGEGFNPYAQ